MVMGNIPGMAKLSRDKPGNKEAWSLRAYSEDPPDFWRIEDPPSLWRTETIYLYFCFGWNMDSYIS